MALANGGDLDPNGPYGSGPAPTILKPGDPGYRLSTWDPNYDPGGNWNNGIAPTFSDPYLQYNNNSPVNEALKADHGWEWSGVTSPTWNMSNNQWDYGRWNQVQGRGIGYVKPGDPPPGGTTTTTTTAGPTGPSGTGAVAGVPATPTAAMTIPSSTLPADIAALFNQKPTQTPVQSAYQDALLKYLGKAQTTPSLDDPTLAPQVEVYRAQAQRGQERQRLAASERAAANGMSESGYLDNLIMKGIQDQNFNTAGFNANLLGGEMNKRRDELQAGLRLAAATGDAESARELQARLAQVSAMMQQQGLNLQGQLGQGDLALRWGLGMEGLNQRALEIMLGAM